jgi:hypothetical protein
LHINQLTVVFFKISQTKGYFQQRNCGTAEQYGCLVGFQKGKNLNLRFGNYAKYLPHLARGGICISQI